MPNEVFYMNMLDSGTELTMSCIAKDKMTVAKFIETLKGMGFSSVYVPSITEVQVDGKEDSFVSFSVTCSYQRGDMDVK